MKKTLSFLFLFVTAVSCNSGSDKKNEGDSANTENPTAIQDTSAQHPNGVTSGSVISTDTSKMDVHNMQQKGKDSSK
jgi:hypothetical protein